MLIHSPANGGLVDLHDLRADWEHVAWVDDTLMTRVQSAYLGLHWAWAALAFLLAVNLFAIVALGLLRAFA